MASFQGDGVLAFFGYPSAHETDAERAIRAGLELTERVPGLSAASNGGGGRSHAPLVRPGGASHRSGDDLTGPCHSSTGGHGAVGEAVNLAARLQAAGPPGAVLVSRETLELVEGLFDTEPLGPQEIRGLSRVVFVHRVLRARSVADRGWNRARRGATRLVGRDRPLRELVQHWHEAAREGTFRFVHVLGEAGVGKTRLVAELCAQVEAEEASAVQASCLEIFSNTPLYPAASLLWSRSGLTAEDGAARSRAKILRFLSAFGRKAAPEEVEVAAGLLGIRGTAPDESAEASSPLIKQKQFALLTSLLERAMGDQPLLLWVEDAHWLDRSSAELLAYLAERFANRPVLAVLTARAPLPEASLTPAAATIRLVPLPLTDCFELARAVPGARALPDEVLLRAAEAADGIPLFAEQLTLSLIDQSAGKDGDARRPATPSDVALPLSLAEMLSERLDRLGEARGIVQAAACAGRAFAPDPLAALLGMPRADVLASLDRLVDAEILRRRHDGAEAMYEFRHTLLQRVAYDSMLAGERRAMHARLADALRRGESVGPVLPGILAHHLTGAGDFTAAARARLDAGIEAARRSAHTEAVEHLRQGLALLDEVADPDARRHLEVALQASLIGPLASLHGTSSAELAACCRRGLQLCMEGEPAAQVFPFLYGLFTIAMARQRLRESLSLAELFVSVAERKKHESGRVIGHRMLGMALLASGEPQRARAALEVSLSLYSAERDLADTHLFGQNTRVHGAALLSVALFCLGEVDEALRVGLGALRDADALRHPHSTAIALGYVGGWLFGHCGATEAQMREARRLIALSDQHRLDLLRAHGEAHLGWALCSQGGLAQGSAVLEGAVSAFEKAGYCTGLVRYISALADARRRAGRLSEAEALAARALRMVREGGEFWLEAEVMRIGALIAHDAGPERRGEAEELLRDAAERARRRGMPVFELWCLLDLARLLGSARPDAAVSARIEELSHLRNLERRAAAAFRQHGYGGGTWRGNLGARRPDPWPPRAANDAADPAPDDAPSLPLGP